MRKNRQQDEVTDILHAILVQHTEHPELRFGQMIANAVRAATGAVNCDPYHVSNEEMLIGLKYEK